MKILVIGDVTSPSGIEHLKRNLWKFRKQNKVDFCVVNGENASFITGISPELAEILLRGGTNSALLCFGTGCCCAGSVRELFCKNTVTNSANLVRGAGCFCAGGVNAGCGSNFGFFDNSVTNGALYVKVVSA